MSQALEAWPGRKRVAGPHVIDVIDSEVRMLEQVRGLSVDLERVFLIQQI